MSNRGPSTALTLEKIIGITCSNQHQVQKYPKSSSNSQPLVALCAASAVILYDTIKNTQTDLFVPSLYTASSITNTRVVTTVSTSEQLNASQAGNESFRRKSNLPMRGKSISCLNFSTDGRYLAVGEYGHLPRLLIWDTESRNVCMDISGHSTGIQCVQFMKGTDFICSVGFEVRIYICMC